LLTVAKYFRLVVKLNMDLRTYYYINFYIYCCQKVI